MNIPTQSVPAGFLDESSGLHQPAPYFIIALVVVQNPYASIWARLIKRARGRLRKKRHAFGELKFDKVDDRTRRFVLGELSKVEEAHIYVTVVDKEGRRVPDTPQHYGMVVGQAAVDFLGRNDQLHLTVDKRYINAEQDRRFTRTVVRIALGGARVGFALTTLESERSSLIQLADFVAGAFNRKYNYGDAQFADRIAGRVKSERVYKWRALKERWRAK